MTELRIASLVTATIALSLAGCGDNKTATTTTAETTVPAAAPEPTAPATAPPTTATATETPGPALAASAVAYASLTGDAAKGEKVFGQCRTCHVVQEGVNRVGPSLWGVVGRKAGSIEGFKYSPANKNSGFVWTEAQLFTYLEAPQKVLKGTYMAFGGLKKPQDRADVIAYLKTKA
jgi:cytochrome c